MAKIRINKLALELNIQNDQIIDALHEKDIPVKNYMSSIEGETADFIRELFDPEFAAVNMKAKAVKAKIKITIKTAAKKVIKAPVKAKAKTVIKAEPKTTAKTAIKKKFSSEKSELTPLLDLKPTTRIISKTEKPTEIKAVAEAEPAKAPKKHGLKIVKKEDKPKAAAKKPKAAPKPAKEKTKKPKPVREKSQPPVAAKEPPPTEPQEVEEETFETVEIPPNIHVRDLADKLKCAANDIIMNLMGLGIMTTINQSLDFDVASKVADQRGFEVILVTPESEIGFEEEEEDLEKDRVHRAPIVTIMGHVDHGKTSLLDAIRETNLAKQEAGGITQHIGAYQAKIKGSLITFLDTPGHEAFTAMRARGVQVTDIVVLVVAADDGIKPQTKEAIDHANAAGVPILVAINKIDKADAKPDEVKKQLADQGLLPEDWGGQTIFTEVSALQKTGIDHLLEMILLQAEIMDLKVNPKVKARAAVIESKLDKGRGPVATLIIQKGTLKIGDPFIVGCYFGKVRALISDNGSKILQAPPATPVEVVGLPDVPQPGDEFMVVQDEKKARQLSNLKLQRQRESILAQSSRITMDDLHQQIVEGKIKELNLIIKADVQGSIHAVQEAFSKLESDEVRIKVIHDGVGGITESDVLLSTASNAIIIGFNVRPTDKAAQLAARDNVDIRLYNIIYDAIDDMKKALEGLLEPKFTERTIGKAEVREVFTIPKVGTIAGCHVVSGKIERLLDARLIRDSVVVYQGKIASIRRFKEDVKEVLSGYECGISLDKYQDVKQGDIIEPFILEEVT
ncbi:MAG: translation initiation factor IF-2 [Nitrospinae bacterium]|nr:translation initiation factor IF-2 [Nitrospinota bacterium]